MPVKVLVVTGAVRGFGRAIVCQCGMRIENG